MMRTRMSLGRRLCVLLAVLVASGARAASAQSADQLWQTAQQRYRAGDHAGAAVAARQAAEAGNLIATYEIGYMYENGDGVPQSEDQALRWFKTERRRVAVNAIAHSAPITKRPNNSTPL